MKIIVYAGAELMTGDAIATTLMEYCAALAQESAAETIEIPFLDEAGALHRAIVVVGPASQIIAKDIDSDFDDVIDTAVVRLLEQRTLAHRPVVLPRSNKAAPLSFTEQWDADI